MKIPKPTDEDRERFTALVPNAPGVEVKPMFGNLGAFVNGNMFMGLFGSDIGVKLARRDRARAGRPGAGPFGPAERPMGGYVTLPARRGRARKASSWTGKALAQATALPPKVPKKAKAKKASA